MFSLVLRLTLYYHYYFFSGVVFNDSSQLRAYQLPIAGHDNDNGNESVPNLPPAPSNVTSNHPLLVRHADTANTTSSMSTRYVRRSGDRIGRFSWSVSPFVR